MGIKRKITVGYVLIVAFIGIFALLCLYPFLMVISGSLTSRAAATAYGFSLIPREFTTEAYRVLFVNSTAIFQAYRVTIFVTIFGTIASLLVNSMMAFALARPNLAGQKFINIVIITK